MNFRRLFVCLVALSFVLTVLLAAAFAQQDVSAPVRPALHPTLSFTSYLLSPADRINAVAVSRDGSVYLAGVTLPGAAGFDVTRLSAGEGDAFVAKLSPDGARILYLTYLGHTGLDEARAIAVDRNGNTYVAGKTRAKNFAVVAPLQAACKLDGAGECAGTAFVARLNADGAVVFATYLGGSGQDEANAIAVDVRGNVYVAGSTTSLDFPVEKAVQPTAAGNGDAFVTMISADGSRLLFSTYLGGSDTDAARGIAVDAAGGVYLTGKTSSLDFPMNNALQSHCGKSARGGCAGSAFVTKFAAGGKSIQYSTYLGGNGGDAGNAIAVDSRGSAYVAGVTGSSDFPMEKAAQAGLKGQSNAFISKLSPQGSALMFSTFLGGSGAEQANAIAIDRFRNVVVAGWTYSPDFPLQAALQSACVLEATGGCGYDSFVADLNSDGATLRFSSYLGGSGADVPRAIAVDPQGSAYLAGWTTSRDFPQAKMPQVSANVAKPRGAGSRKVGGSFVAKVSGLQDSDAPNVTCGGGTKNWTGTAGDNLWQTAGNWTPSGVPVSTDNVCIASTFSSTITVGSLVAANQTIASLVSGAPISFSTGPLTSTGTATFAALTMTGGTLTLSASSTMTTLSMTGGVLTGAGDVSISGLLTWGSASMCTNFNGSACTAPVTQAVTNANGGISITGNAALQGRTLNNAGTATYTSGFTFQMFLSSIVNNPSGGVWDVGHDGNISVSGAGNVFNNSGTLKKTVGSSSSFIDVPFSNLSTGTVQANSGVVFFRGGGDCGSSCPGTWTVGASGNLQFVAGTYVLTGDFTNTPGGTLLFNGGNLNFVKAGTTTINGALNLTGGVVYGPATLTITGLLTWQTASMCTNFNGSACTAPVTQGITNANGGISIAGNPALQGRTLNNPGTTTYTAGFSFQMFLAAIVNNPMGGVWDVGHDGSITVSGAGNVFNNSGTLTKTVGSSNSFIDVPFSNLATGTVQANSGMLLFRGGGDCGSSCPGTWTVGASGNLQFVAGTYVLTGDFTNTPGGTLLFSGANMNFVKAGTTTINGALNLTGGVVYGPATLTITGLLTWQTASMCTNFNGSACTAPVTQGITNANGGISIAGNPALQGRTLNNAGTTTYTAGFSFQMFLAAIVNNPSGRVWDVGHDGSITVSGAGNVFNNSGTLTKTVGSSNSFIDVPFSNLATGTVQANSGMLLFRGGGDCGSSCPGTWTVGASGNLQFLAGTYVLTGDMTNNSGGTLLFNGANLNFVKAGTTTITGTLNHTAGVVFGPATLTITGYLTWGGGSMCTNFNGSACTAPVTEAVTNANGGISITGNPALQGRTLNNAGTAHYTAAFSLQMFLASIVNNQASGVWDVSLDGSITVNGSGNVFNNAGTLKKISGTGTSFVDPTFNNSGAVQANSGNVAFRGTAYTQTAGTTSMGGGNIQFTSTALEPGGSFTGAGTITGTLSNSGGAVSPGTSTVVGTIAMTGPGNYTQGASTAYNVKVGGSVSGQYDAVTLAGTATLNGAINLSLINGFLPANGTQFTVMTFASKTGQFSSVTSGWSMSYTATAAIATFNGGGGSPVVKLSATTVKFATTVVGVTAKAKKITVSNTGTAALNITSITASGDFSQTNTCGSVLNAGANCSVTIKFKPTDKGTRTGSLTLTDNASPGTQSVTLSGVGTFLSVVPNPIAFAAQLVNTTSGPLTVTFQNVNPTTPLTITSVTLTGTNAGEFTQNSACGVIPANGSCVFNMTFTPGALGKRAASLKVVEDGGGSPLSIKISGSGTNVTLSPSPVAFGTVSVGTTKPLVVTLTNHSPSSAVVVSTVTIAGTNKGDFTASKDVGCNSVAANGGTCSITVNFKPTATGARSGILSVKDNDSGSPQTDNLTGTGQ